MAGVLKLRVVRDEGASCCVPAFGRPLCALAAGACERQRDARVPRERPDDAPFVVVRERLALVLLPAGDRDADIAATTPVSAELLELTDVLFVMNQVHRSNPKRRFP